MTSENLPKLVTIPHFDDSRGTFSKPFYAPGSAAPDFTIRELFWTRSKKGSVRGLHFQTPPHAVNKLVWVSQGSIIDVVVDVRRDGDYGRVHPFELDATSGNALWIPVGFAHGFQALHDDSIVNYAVDCAYAPEHDTGILWDSVNFEWPLPIGEMSERDTSFTALNEFDSPFGEDR